MPVINPPKVSDIYTNVTNIRNAHRNRSTISITPIPNDHVLKSDGLGSTDYLPGNTTLVLESALVSSISSHSVTVFGENTFTSQGSTFFLGPVHLNSLRFNTQETTSIALGYQAGAKNQGSDSIAIGRYAGTQSQLANTIILNTNNR